jgi:hypothetical protein
MRFGSKAAGRPAECPIRRHVLHPFDAISMALSAGMFLESP